MWRRAAWSWFTRTNPRKTSRSLFPSAAKSKKAASTLIDKEKEDNEREEKRVKDLVTEGANVLEENGKSRKRQSEMPPGPMHARFRRRNRQDRVVNQR
ncbi:hypothetical protein CI102_6591 [Trichoderma harzianum]|nr:hypothetical protein CI102_6591 [Trichoderma harzianum]